MRSCLFLGVLTALLTSFATVSTAQPDFRGSASSARGGSRPAPSVTETFAPPAAVSHSSGGIIVDRNTKLTAGDAVTIKIVEDRDPTPLSTVVSVTGEVELNGLGRVAVSGKSSSEAEALIASYLRQKCYHRATVEFALVSRIPGNVSRFKVQVTGKVARPGPVYFDEANPITLSEAVTAAMTTTYSKTDKIRLTRGGQTTEHDMRAIIKDGRTDLDVRLRDGDKIYVPEKGITFRSGD